MFNQPQHVQPTDLSNNQFFASLFYFPFFFCFLYFNNLVNNLNQLPQNNLSYSQMFLFDYNFIKIVFILFIKALISFN
jgi:hypothetical protein